MEKKIPVKENYNEKDLLDKYINISALTNEEVLKMYNSDINGLSKYEANKRLNEYGPNIIVKNEKKPFIWFLINSFNDKFIFILLALAIVSIFLNDYLGSLIIIIITIISALIRCIQDYSVYKFNRQLKSRIFINTNVIREGFPKQIKTEQVIKGDIIELNAGSIIPADLFILESKDLFVNQSVFTGESIPIEKTTKYNDAKEIFDLSNIGLMGTSVVNGRAIGVVINTSFNTFLGHMNDKIIKKREETNFDKGMSDITKMLIKYMIIVSIAVFFIYGFLRGDFLEALLFSLSVAVGITPTMLPMIVNVNLTTGSKSLAEKKTLVKNIESIQNLGAIDILCTDKTGTLTEDRIVLQKYIDPEGDESREVLEYAYINSFYSTGIKNIVDKAIIAYGKLHKVNEAVERYNYNKVDEIPFDYTRRKTSIVIKNNNDHLMITKGALEEIIKCCSTVQLKTGITKLNNQLIKNIEQKADELSSSGMQVIALASKSEYPGIDKFNQDAETEMTFIGFVAFLDPIKKDVKETINKLKGINVSTKILTGDNAATTKNICELVDLKNKNILLGTDIENMSDEELSKVIEEVDVFARLNPIQKERVVAMYKQNGHVVGFMGDGVNDALALHKADVGICVNTATDIAKETADIILLEKSLDVVHSGVLEGRRVYGNMIKYMKMALSANVGDVFSILVASIFIPFLPLIPIQMLLQDFIYEISQIAIPYDDVDQEFLVNPRKWNTKGIKSFMNVMGLTSSVTDIISFIVFWFVFGWNTVAEQSYFQTAWFVECLISMILIIHFVRTSKIPFIESRANKYLMAMSILAIIATILTPIILHNISSFHFVLLPLNCYIFIAILMLVYAISVEFVKKSYIKKHSEWL